MSYQIPAVWAYVSIDEKGSEEGVVGVPTPNGGWMPLICCDERRRDTFRAYAEAFAGKTGRAVRLLKFTGRQEIETLLPGRSNAT